MNQLKIFSGSANPGLAKAICDHLSQQLGEIYHHQFPSGEHYSRYMENIRGADVFLVQPLTTPVNEHLMQLLIMADAARRASADRITAVIPYMGYSRQDRKDKSRTPISAKLVLDVIQAAGINRVITMDLHAPQIQGFTNIPFDHLNFAPSLIHTLTYGGTIGCHNSVVVAPDVGAVKRAEQYAEKLKCDLAIITKKRMGDTSVEHTSFVGDVTDKNVFLIDDLTESCGTLIGAAKLCKEKGARHVTCAVTHPCLTKMGVERLSKAIIQEKVIDRFYQSDTVSYWWHLKRHPLQVQTISTAKVFSRAIKCVHENESVSELFE